MSFVAYRPGRVAAHSMFTDHAVRNLFSTEWPAFAPDTAFVPAVNIKETEAAFALAFAVPGRKKEDLKVAVEANVLTVSYVADKTAEKEDGHNHTREFTRKSFSRSFKLPETVQADHISADYTDGILHLTLPKNAKAAAAQHQVVIN